MDYSDNIDQFGVYNDPFGNLLDEEIPQDIFDEIMNDVNFNAMGFGVDSLSSEDSGRSSSSYDDTINNKMDTFTTVPTVVTESPQFMTAASVVIKEEPKSPNSFYCSSPESNHANQNVVTTASIKANNTSPPPSQPQPLAAKPQTSLPIAQPMFTVKPTFAQIHQPQILLSQPKILVKQEPIQIQQQTTRPQILTLQNIGGQLYTTVSTASNQTPVHTIVNGTTGILTKIPIVPMQQTVTTQNKIAVATVALQQTTTLQQTNSMALAKTTKASKKSGHNIIERRYRTSIVIIIIKSLFFRFSNSTFYIFFSFRTTK